MKGYLKPWMSADTLRLAAAANMAFLFPHLYARPPRPERPWEIERAARMRPVASVEPKITRQQARKSGKARALPKARQRGAR